MFQPSALNGSLASARTDDITRVARRIRPVRPAAARCDERRRARQSGMRPSPVKSTAASVNERSAGGTMI